MNTLSWMNREYRIDTSYNDQGRHWNIYFSNEKYNDMAAHQAVTKIELETLRINARRIIEAIDSAIGES